MPEHAFKKGQMVDFRPGSCATNSAILKWAAIKPFLPNKSRGVLRRVDDRRVLQRHLLGPAFGRTMA